MLYAEKPQRDLQLDWILGRWADRVPLADEDPEDDEADYLDPEYDDNYPELDFEDDDEDLDCDESEFYGESDLEDDYVEDEGALL
jgi:hypothetical protein